MDITLARAGLLQASCWRATVARWARCCRCSTCLRAGPWAAAASGAPGSTGAARLLHLQDACHATMAGQRRRDMVALRHMHDAALSCLQRGC